MQMVTTTRAATCLATLLVHVWYLGAKLDDVKAPEFTAGLVAGLLAGLAIAAAVAWYNWPSSTGPPATRSLAIHALPDYQLSATEHVRAIVIPDEMGAFGTLCVVYVNSELHLATMQCPREDFLARLQQDDPK
jgi:hypothetical protein